MRLLSSFPFAVTIAACGFLCMVWGNPPRLRAESDAPDPVRLRELYVPIEHFRELTRNNPDGVVLELSEYRSLVQAALAHREKQLEVVLPPVDASVKSVLYQGRVEGDVARFTARARVRVNRDGWVRCPLGPSLPYLGEVRVNGTDPGWVLHDRSSGHTTLLLRGAGDHEVELSFTAPIREENERRTLGGSLLPAATSSLELVIPGIAEGEATPALLSTKFQNEETVFRLPLGNLNQFQLQWSRRKTLEENPALLRAIHQLSFLPRPENPAFTWDARVEITRRDVGQLIFEEPAGATVLAVDGDLLHSWAREEGQLRVRLKDETTGPVRLRFSGVFEVQNREFAIQPPSLRGAYSNLGTIALLSPGAGRLRMTSVRSVRELDPLNREVPPVATHGAAGTKTPSVYRLYEFPAPGSQLVARVEPEPLRLNGRTSYLVQVGENTLTVDGFLRAELRSGRTYELSIDLPEDWRLLGLARLNEDAQDFRYESLDGQVLVRVQRALTPARPLEMQIRLELPSFRPEREWTDRELAFTLPTLRATQESRTDLVLTLHDSLVLATTDLPGWQVLPSDETRRLGVDLKVKELSSTSARLAGAVTTTAPLPQVQLDLVQRKTRGEYRSVTHLLAAERAYRSESESTNAQHTMRVRCDVRLALVDRAVEEIVFRHPKLAAGTHVIVLGDDLKEIDSDPAGGRQRVRFVRPWLGIRQFRIEYETGNTPGASTSVPLLAVEGDFGSERFLVLQSQGSVEVTNTPGPGLTSVDIDDIPDFAEPWADGRVLSAFRYRRAGNPGTFRAELHDRAPIRGRLARELQLTTVFGRDGVARTHAEMILTYSREQSLRFRLPGGAVCLSAAVDGDPVRALRTTRTTEGEAVLVLPLPPRTFARVTFVYEQRKSSLGAWGNWQARGPVLLDIPVGSTRWSVHHPDGYRFHVAGGNVRSTTPDLEVRDRLFASTFFGRLLQGRLPRFTVLSRDFAVRDQVSVPPLPEDEWARAQSAWAKQQAASSAQNTQRITPRGGGAALGAERAPRLGVFPEGRRIEVSKLGGNPNLHLSYRRLGWAPFARGSVFLATILTGLTLLLLGQKRSLRRLLGWGLFLGTLVPVALDLESPLLLVPFCEALVVLCLAWPVGQLLLNVGRQWLSRRKSQKTHPAVAILLLGCFLGAGLPSAGHAQDQGLPEPFDEVLIPYSGQPGDAVGKVFLPEKRFEELWKLAHPDPTASPPLDPPPIPSNPWIAGNAKYTIELQADARYRLVGTLFVYSWTEDWISLPLTFDRAQLLRVQVNGADQGVFQSGAEARVQLRGTGRHRIDLELQGVVAIDRGEYRISTTLLVGSATRVQAELPGETVLVAQRTGPSAAQTLTTNATGASVRQVHLNLADASQLDLTWTFPRVEGKIASQRESTSYSLLRLTPDGFDVLRTERVRVAGRAVESTSYQIIGDWEIAAVRSPELSEWTVIRSENEAPRLVLNFARPIREATLQIRGHARLASQGAMATLALEDAVHQESYFGLRHGAGRRFDATSLADLPRVSDRDLRRAFGTNDLPGADRIHHAFDSGGTSRLVVVARPVVQKAVTDGVAIVRNKRVQVFLRTRYTQTRPGPLRHRVALPDGWSVRKVRGEAIARWEVLETTQPRDLLVTLRGRAEPGAELIWSAEFDLRELPTTLLLPALTSRPDDEATRREESFQWLVASTEELSPVVGPGGSWEPTGSAHADWLPLPAGVTPRLAYRTRRGEAPLEVRIEQAATQISATTVTFARLAEEALQISGRVRYRVRGAGRDTFRLRLPAGAELVYLDTTNQRAQEVRTTPGPDSRPEIVVRLQSPARGDVFLDLRYRLPRAADGTSPMLGAMTLLDGTEPLSEVDHYVGVLQTERSFTLETRIEGLHPVEAETFPYLPRGLSPLSLRPTYRASRPEWSLLLSEQEIEVAAGPAAVIKLADLATIIGPDGTLRTEVIYTLINRRLQFLMVELPPEADLWGVTVNGRPVAVGRSAAGASATAGDPRALRIPVERLAGSELPVDVSIVYEQPALTLPAYEETAELQAPRIPPEQAVRVHESVWSVQFPADYRLEETSRRMRQAPPSLKQAEKLRALLDQQEQVFKASRSYTSRRAQEQAAQQLARISQALGDNLAELEGQNRSASEMSQQSVLGVRNLEKQWVDNDLIMKETRRAQSLLQQELKRNDARTTSQVSPDEQSFQDRARFLAGREWRRGSRHPAEDAARPDSAEPLDEFLEEHNYSGLNSVKLRLASPQAVVAEPKTIDAQGGLAPLPDLTRPTTSPAFRPGEEREGYITYTFQRGDADARLELSLERPGFAPRALAWLLLIAVLGGYLWLRRD